MFNNRLFKFAQEVVDNSPSDVKLDIENNSNNEQEENSDKRVVEQIHDISKDLSYFSLDFLLALNRNFERAFFDYIRKTAIDPEIREKIDTILKNCANLFSNLGTYTTFDVQDVRIAKQLERTWLNEIQELDPILYERLVPRKEAEER